MKILKVATLYGLVVYRNTSFQINIYIYIWCLFVVLFEFHLHNGRYPDTKHLEEDGKQLQSLRSKWLPQALGIESEVIPEDFWK